MKRPQHIAHLIATHAKAFNIEVLYFRPRDIDMERERVHGRIYREGKWVSVTTKIPKFNDVSAFCYRPDNLEALKYLKERSTVSEPGTNRFNKMKMQELLKKDGEFADIIPSTKRVVSFEVLKDFLNELKMAILKPVGGQFGRSIFFIEKVDQAHYRIKFSNQDNVVSEQEFMTFYEEEIRDKKFIIQQYINSMSKENYPFDCRINAEKDINGKWTIARKFIRIGIGQSVVSNMSQGGAAMDAETFLKSNYPNKWEEINNKLEEIGRTLPYKVEELRNAQLMTIGIDIGIDSDGQTYLFETNSAPGTTQLRAQVALLRVSYYRYMLGRV